MHTILIKKFHKIFIIPFIKGLELYRTKKVYVQANSAQSVSFMITPIKLGPMNIKAKATSIIAGDAIEYPLLVKVSNE